MIKLVVFSALFAGLPGGGCGDDSSATDASLPDARAADAATGEPPDAFDLCAGQLTFTGDFTDWDSTDMMFRGIFDATLKEIGNETNTAQTAPNGRGLLCVTPDADADFEFTHTDYRTMVFSMDAAAAAAGPFSIHGITPARETTLFATDLGLTRDATAALVIVEVRRYPGLEPVVGATVAIGGANDGAFTQDASRVYQSGAVTTDGAYVLFANVVVGAGTTSVTVTPPAGTTCAGRQTIGVVAGQMAATTFACQ